MPDSNYKLADDEIKLYDKLLVEGFKKLYESNKYEVPEWCVRELVKSVAVLVQFRREHVRPLLCIARINQERY